MNKIYFALIILGILSFAFISLVSAMPEIQEWCFTYFNGYTICGESKTILNDFIDKNNKNHFNYKQLTKIDIYLPSGELCNTELHTTHHNYLTDQNIDFITRIHSFYNTQGLDFNACTFDFSKELNKYNKEGLQFCKGEDC